MTTPFDVRGQLVLVTAGVLGPSGRAQLQMALDTGATTSVISSGILEALGYRPKASVLHHQVITATRSERVSMIHLDRILTCDLDRINFPVFAMDFPVGAQFEGLLGLDFVRGMRVTIDFRKGEILIE